MRVKDEKMREKMKENRWEDTRNSRVAEEWGMQGKSQIWVRPSEEMKAKASKRNKVDGWGMIAQAKEK